MTKTILSICIPNYNRPKQLAQNLSAIAKQAKPGVEIVIVDDHSPDRVEGIISSFRKEHPYIKLIYKRNRQNLGFDENVLKVINNAQGEYCWLLSNDDQILPGGIARVLQAIAKLPDLSLILVNYSRFDKLAEKQTAGRMIGLRGNRHFYDFNEFFFSHDDKGYFPFLGQNSLTMSTNIFRRSYWFECVRKIDRRKVMGFNFIHAFVIPFIIRYHPNILYISQPQVRYLANNSKPWPNHIWQDYNTHLIDFLAKNQYNSKKLTMLKLTNYQYIIKEALIKTGWFYSLYQALGKIRITK